MPTVHLHGFWRSSSAHRVRIALALKGIPHTRHPVHLGRREQLEPAFLQAHPAGQVPILEVDGLVLTQSVAILQFLDRTWPEPPLFPADPKRAAQVWEIVERINSFVQPLQLPGTVRRHLLSHLPGDADALQAGVQRFVVAQMEDSLARLDAAIRHRRGQFCAGDEPTAADVLLVPQLDGAERLGLDLTALPSLREVRDRCLALPAFQRAAPHAQAEAPRPAG